ncbi:MAG: response regulator [Elusimicrobiota bacterium]
MYKKIKVLVADEDKDIRFHVKMCMRDYLIELIEAKNRDECIEFAKKEMPRLIIINYMLSGIDGYHLAEELSKGEALDDSFVIMMTLEGFDLIKERVGVDDYLAKPFSREMFLETLKKIPGLDIDQYKKNIVDQYPKTDERNRRDRDKKDASRKRILIADDEPDIIKLLKAILENNYDLEVATTGAELLEKALAGSYDLIISDVVMPKMSGWKSVKEIREGGCYTPVIFNSGLVKDQALYETLKPEGPSRFILKPFKIAQINELITELLEDTH